MHASCMKAARSPAVYSLTVLDAIIPSVRQAAAAKMHNCIMPPSELSGDQLTTYDGNAGKEKSRSHACIERESDS